MDAVFVTCKAPTYGMGITCVLRIFGGLKVGGAGAYRRRRSCGACASCRTTRIGRCWHATTARTGSTTTASACALLATRRMTRTWRPPTSAAPPAASRRASSHSLFAEVHGCHALLDPCPVESVQGMAPFAIVEVTDFREFRPAVGPQGSGNRVYQRCISL